QRQPLHREVPALNAESPLDFPWSIVGRHHRQVPRLDPWLGVDVDTDESGPASGIRKERQGSTAERAFEDDTVRNALDVDPRDVADADAGRMPGDRRASLSGCWPAESTGRSHDESEEGGGERQADAAERHSGRCWRRNCSNSATSSEAGGRSLSPAPGVGSSSTSFDSSLAT